MDKIASFNVNHNSLLPGLYLSRRDEKGGVCVSTFDMRITAPNREKVLDTAPLHTIEHLGATFLRNSPQKDDVVYFGPMGCRTGCYLLMFGRLESADVYPLIIEMCDFIINFNGEIPGAKPEECGNYSDQNLLAAQKIIEKYKEELVENRRFEYPE